MMFFRTNQGYIPAHKIDLVEHAPKDANHQRIFADGKIVGNTVNFENSILDSYAAIGWEVLTICEAEDGICKLESCPVIAWGRVVGGWLVPITPEKMDGLSEPHILREKESGKMWGNHGEEILSSEDWLADYGGKK